MSKNYWSNLEKLFLNILLILVCLACLSPLLVFSGLLFPFVTSKAFFFRIFVELALPFYLYLIWTKSNLRISKKNPILLAVLAFFGFGLVSAIFGVNLHFSIWSNFERMGGMFHLAHMVLLFLYIFLFAKSGDKYLRNFLYYILGISVIVSINGIFGKIGWTVLVKDASLPARVSSTLGNPIFLASFLIIPLGFSIFFARQAVTVMKKNLFWVLAFLILIIIFFSGTRGALVGLVVGLFFGLISFLFLESSKKVKLYVILSLFVFTIILGGAIFFKSSFSGLGLGRLLNFQDSNSKARLIQWGSAWQGFLEKPVFGVGPENYYYVSNKYYNPQMVQYDASWFDKPHNYILEILSTQGLLGFISYGLIIIFSLFSLYRAYKQQLLDLVEMCVLSGVFVAYFIQNLFVFDTLSAAMMFYIFIAFSAFLWEESRVDSQDIKKQNKLLDNKIFYGRIIFVVSSVLVLCVTGITNIAPMIAAKNINSALSVMAIDPEAGNKYFQEAINSTFNFSMQDTVIRYSEFARKVYQDPKLSTENKSKILNQIVSAQKISAERIKNDPLSWIQVSNGLFILDIMQNREVGEGVEKYAKYALSLAPNRYDPYFQLYQIYNSRHKTNEEGDILREIDTKFPLNNFTSGARWGLAYWSYKNDKKEEGVKLAEVLINKEYPPQSLLEILWLLQYYDEYKDYNHLLSATKLAVKGMPDNKDLTLVLAQAYALNGMKDEAVRIATEFGKESSENQARAKVFLDSIQ